MPSLKTLYAQTCVYDSAEAEGFQDSNRLPIAWEIIFLNDRIGKIFAANAAKAFAGMLQENGRILDLIGEPEDKARSLECVFKNRAQLQKALNEMLPNIVIYDEQKCEVVSQQALCGQADKIRRKLAV